MEPIVPKSCATYWPRRCSRWANCSVGQCPLDPQKAFQRVDSNDPMKFCGEPLRHRIEIVAEAKADGVDLGDACTQLERKSITSGKATVASICGEFDRKLSNRLDGLAKMRASQAQKARQSDLAGAGDETTPPGGSTPPPEALSA